MPLTKVSIRRMIVVAKTKTKNSQLPLLESLAHYDQSLENEFMEFQTPSYVSDNMKHTFRYYQDNAFRYFHYMTSARLLQYLDSNHVLFNMATGSGKTDLMAGLILYLYQEHGYQQFLFTVNTTSVLKKTIDNLTNPSSDKYLYQNPIEIEGERIRIEKVNQFPQQLHKNVIYLKLDTIQGVASDLFTEKENTMGIREYERSKTVILADEAHHYSASTKTEKENEKSWERTIDLILDAHEESRLLEFTATIDLDNKKVYEKYKDKVIYRYTLDRYIIDGYSKNINRIQSSNTDWDNMMNVILLSEFRRRYAKEFYDIQMKPVILFKSPRVKDSLEAEEKFNRLVSQLTPESILEFVEARYNEKTEEFSNTLYRTYHYYLSNQEDLTDIVREMKRQFAPNRIINANKTGLLDNEDQYQALNSLESPSNLYRVVFAVAKLTEGWDVLNLFDIVRLSDSPSAKGTKTATNAEAQLIGRGARYYPFELDGDRSYTRRFEDDSRDSLILETLHYHTINEPQYLKNLVKSLDEMDLPTGVDQKNPPHPVKVKGDFKKTDIYQKGHIYYNEVVDLDDSYYSNLNKYGGINQEDIYIDWKLTTREVDYSSKIVEKDYENVRSIPVKYDKRIVLKAMDRNSFFHFDNLKQYVPLLASREEFLSEDWLNLANRNLYATVPSSYSSKHLSPVDRLDIFSRFLTEVEQLLKSGYQKSRGTNRFVAFPIKEYIVDYNKRVPNYEKSYQIDSGRSNPQQVSRREYKDRDYFVYDSAIINKTEEQLVDQIGNHLDDFLAEYDAAYLIRMDENMHRETVKSDDLKLHQFEKNPQVYHFEGFQPDFILLLQNEDVYLQIFIEPKSPALLEREEWKEELLQYINDNEDLLEFEEEISGVKVKGLKFYTMNDGQNALDQLAEISLGRPFEGISFKETTFENMDLL